MKMSLRSSAVISALSLFLVLSVAINPAEAAWSCVPYVRQVSAVSLKGDAWLWWNAASGVYAKGHTPKVGSVLVFKRTGDMRRGHVAVVRQVVSNRRIIVDHANWSRKGGIDRNVAVVDVSVKNDWSKTRVWYGPIHALGDGVHPAYGFIYAPNKATVHNAVMVSEADGGTDVDDLDVNPATEHNPRLIQANYAPPDDATPVLNDDVSDDRPVAASSKRPGHKMVHAKAAPQPDRKPVKLEALVSNVWGMLNQDLTAGLPPLPSRKPNL